MSKKVIYLNLSESSENSLASLKDKLIELSKDKTLGGFLSMELLRRRDDIMFSDKSPEYKEGALQQIIEITDMLFGIGASEIQKVLTQKNKVKSVKSEDIKEFQNKVLNKL